MGEFSIYQFLKWLSYPFLHSAEHPMIFTEYPFWIFFLFVLIGYCFLHKKLRARSIFLFLVSIYFYYKTSGFFFTILLFSTLLDYFIGKGIYHSTTQKKAQLLLGFSVSLNLFILIYFKYDYFYIMKLREKF